MSGWPRYSPIFGATTRRPTSGGPPAAKPMITRMGFCGYCACASDAAASSAASATFEMVFMSPLPFLDLIRSCRRSTERPEPQRVAAEQLGPVRFGKEGELLLREAQEPGDVAPVVHREIGAPHQAV